jgi:hypothetical protein
MRFDRASGRRVATIGLLALASALCVALVAARDERTGTGEYRFLVWADEVDPDELFASGRAWGIMVTRLPLSVAGAGRHRS